MLDVNSARQNETEEEWVVKASFSPEQLKIGIVNW